VVSRAPRWWRRIGPQLVGQATPFRLYQEPRTVAYFPATIRQPHRRPALVDRPHPHPAAPPRGPAVIWRKSSRCESHTCVETLATIGGSHMIVADSKVPNWRIAVGTWLKFSRPAWTAFLDTIR
jgi:hypothetical protein